MDNKNKIINPRFCDVLRCHNLIRYKFFIYFIKNNGKVSESKNKNKGKKN